MFLTLFANEGYMTLHQSRNKLIGLLSGTDRERLAELSEYVQLKFKQTLFEPGKRVDYVYFVETGVVSLLIDLDGNSAIETGTVGNEGMVGVAALLGVDRAFNRAICQIPGSAFRFPAAVIAAEREQGTLWFKVLLRFVNFTDAMSAQSAACNRMHSVEARMSKWLLMTHDRVEEDDFPLTQEFIAQMLGVARPTVNIAGATLQRAGFIRYSRGRITVVDRAGLESASCECYARIRDEMRRAVGGNNNRRDPKTNAKIRRMR